MEAFFDRFAELPPGPVGPEVFAALGRDAGMEVLSARHSRFPIRSRRGRRDARSPGDRVRWEPRPGACDLVAAW